MIRDHRPTHRHDRSPHSIPDVVSALLVIGGLVMLIAALAYNYYHFG